eukprot:TRINITY_DN16834_c0_g1_i2.p1 TRINITY_DN16834_c0_g1~~TRINITY_DN16834_c0_g1_i2.p1  ORF type:complete len:118 (-),score=13.56 TRINITY_DN16834_c0_g1_i2:32-385(-)
MCIRDRFVILISFVFITNVFLALFVKCSYWKVQLFLKSAFPSLSPRICRACYCCTLIYATLPYITVFVYSWCYQLDERGLPSAKSIYLGLFLLRDYVTFYQFAVSYTHLTLPTNREV